MPFISVAQFHKFIQMKHQGEISKKTFDEWVKDTNFRTLPSRVGKIKKK